MKIARRDVHTADPALEQLRLADLVAALSVVSDLGMGHPPEEAMRTCLLATALARRTGLDEEDVADVYWTSLLMHVGCTAVAHEQASFFGGEDIEANAVGSRTDFGEFAEVLGFLFEVGRGSPPATRARLLFRGLTRGERFGVQIAEGICEVASHMASRLGLRRSVQLAVRDLFERWDGKGAPRRLAGDEIALPARVAELAAEATVFTRIGGPSAAIEMAARRAGGALDPSLAEAFGRHGEELLTHLDECDPWEAVVGAEPEPRCWIPGAALDDVALIFADATDLKSTFTLGHSRGVAKLATGAGRELGLADPELARLRHASLLHDLGRAAVPNGVWEKPGPLTSGEWEQVRLHPYQTERILSRSPVLAPIATLAGMHHERLDGSGYHRQAAAGEIALEARILAAADAYRGMTEERAHRSALPPSAAADALGVEAREGRLDARAVDAVLAAAGHRSTPPVRQGWPAGLTDREVDVLRLLARGLSNREIGNRLFISPKTVGRHVEHIYRKLSVSSRAAAAMFATRHDLLR